MTSAQELDEVLTPHPAIDTALLLDRVVLFDDRDAGVHELNETASLVWLGLDGRTSLREVADALSSRFDEQLSEAVLEVTREFARLGLLEGQSSRSAGG